MSQKTRYYAKKQPQSPAQKLLKGKPTSKTILEKSTSKTVSASLLWVSLTLFYLIALVSVVYSYFSLPSVLPEPKLHEFNTHLARSHLEKITSFGIRTVGNYPNEVLTPRYILSVLQEIQKTEHQAAENDKLKGVPNHHWKVEIEVQHPSGAFPTTFLGGFVNTYQTVTNVIARLSPYELDRSPNISRPALLINAHYDSAIGAAAAADDTVNCAIMLEIVRTLVSRPRSPKSADIIFLFNGAEETNWQAAHGFVTQHRWASDVKALINLEAAGAGGREIVIQTGPRNAWLIELYATHVPYPRASSVVQDIFQSGIIPGETDFQVFRDYGSIPGIDIANIEDGYVYHTKLDTIERIPPGSIQRAGENTLALAEALASAPDLKVPGPTQGVEAVFFDFLGHFLILYSASTAKFLNFGSIGGVLLFSTLAGLWISPVLYAVGIIILSILGSALVPLLVGTILTFINPMGWFASNGLVIFLFGSSGLLGCLLIRSWYHKVLVTRAGFSHAVLETEFFAAGLWIWAFGLLIISLAGKGTAHVCLVWVGPPVVTRIISHILIPQHAKTNSILFFVLHFLGLVLPALVWGEYFLCIIDFFTPLLGRVGTEIPPDMFLGCLIGLLIGILTIIPLSVIHLASHRVIQRFSAFLVLIIALSLFVTSKRFPFSNTHPKRLFFQYVLHENVNKETDSMYWAIPIDYTRFDHVFKIEGMIGETFRNSKVLPYREGLYADMPWYFPVKDSITYTLRIPAPVYNFSSHGFPGLTLVLAREEHNPQASTRRLTFVARGPDHMGFALRANVVAWSFFDSVPKFLRRTDCDCYYIFHSGGLPYSLAELTNEERWKVQDEIMINSQEKFFRSKQGKKEYIFEFWIDVKMNQTVEINHWGHYLDLRTTDMDTINKNLPSWIDPILWTSHWRGYKW